MRKSENGGNTGHVCSREHLIGLQVEKGTSLEKDVTDAGRKRAHVCVKRDVSDGLGGWGNGVAG